MHFESAKTLAAFFAFILIGTASAQPAVDPPLTYNCPRTPTPIQIDGKLDDPAWRIAPWTTDFVDIQGAANPAKPKPRFRTRAKLLWDDQYLYIAAELEEPDIQATLTEHDSIIFHDNDFEVFLKPPATVEGQPAPGYFEFEINALNTSWDLYLNKPYNQGGLPDNSWNIPGLKSAVAIHGTLNNSQDKDKGWTVEIAFPWAAYASRLPVTPPHAGDQKIAQWRINFSRVEWPAGAKGDRSWSAQPKPGQPKEDNWVWSPQGVVNMHVPEKWGYLNFRDKP
jgi:hypothetical protein